MSAPIQNGTRVTWTAPGGGLRSYAGEIVAYIWPWRSAWDHLPDGCPTTGIACATAQARYVIRCGERYRTALASVIDRQNPGAPRGAT